MGASFDAVRDVKRIRSVRRPIWLTYPAITCALNCFIFSQFLRQLSQLAINGTRPRINSDVNARKTNYNFNCRTDNALSSSIVFFFFFNNFTSRCYAEIICLIKISLPAVTNKVVIISQLRSGVWPKKAMGINLFCIFKYNLTVSISISTRWIYFSN